MVESAAGAFDRWKIGSDPSRQRPLVRFSVHLRNILHHLFQNMAMYLTNLNNCNLCPKDAHVAPYPYPRLYGRESPVPRQQQAKVLPRQRFQGSRPHSAGTYHTRVTNTCGLTLNLFAPVLLPCCLSGAATRCGRGAQQRQHPLRQELVAERPRAHDLRLHARDTQALDIPGMAVLAGRQGQMQGLEQPWAQQWTFRVTPHLGVTEGVPCAPMCSNVRLGV